MFKYLNAEGKRTLTWKIFWMCVANTLVSFQRWDELINKHVWLFVPNATFSC